MDFSACQKNLIKKINQLKKKKKAVILVHNYQRPEIYQIADFIGDSLELAQAGKKNKAKIIVFCGVNFMAETAKILSPQKKVLLPSLDALCPMAAMVTVPQLRELKRKYPKAQTVAYVNTTAEIKAEVDICCTSANALLVINSLKAKEIIFVPDQHLAFYIQTQTQKEIIPWPGYCYVHAKITEAKILEAKKNHPEAYVLVHPECPLLVIKHADQVLSTSGMIHYVQKSPAQTFIIATEIGMVERLKMVAPQKKFFGIGGECLQQKKVTLEKVWAVLQNESNEITLSPEIIKKARRALERMLKIGRQD